MNQNNEALVQRIDNARRYIWGTVPTEESIDSLLLDLREAIASAGVVAEPVGVFHSIPRHTPYGVSWFIESALPEGTKLYTTPPAPAASPVVPEWQPIETAPHDDTALFLLFEPHSQGGFVFVGCRGKDNLWHNNLDLLEQNPTHWMPEPPHPAISSADLSGGDEK